MASFYTKTGWLTPYGMSCGYIHRTDKSRDESVVFEHLSGNAYSVTHWLAGSTGNVSSYGATLRDGIAAYETFQSVSEARKFYKKRVGKLTYRFENNSEVRRNVIV